MSSTKDTDYSFTVRTTAMTSDYLVTSNTTKSKILRFTAQLYFQFFSLSLLHYLYHFQLTP